MSPLFLATVFGLLLSVVHRDENFTLCGPEYSSADQGVLFSSPDILFSNISRAKLPALNVCFNKKLLPIADSRAPFKLALLLLLAGDVSLNPGPRAIQKLQL